MDDDLQILFPRYQVTSLLALVRAAKLKRAIVTTGHFSHLGGHRGYAPASWVLNLNAGVVHNWICSGMYLKRRKDEE